MSLSEDIWKDGKIINALRSGAVAVMPTDTIYGMVGLAGDERVVSRIYQIRRRNPEKPCIILIGDMRDLERFSVVLSIQQMEKLKEFWPHAFPAPKDTSYKDFDVPPEAVSVIFDCPNEALAYLHRGTYTLAFRLPHNKALRELLLQTGPLIAPSANFESFPPNDNIESAKQHFGGMVDIYADAGTFKNKASKVARLYPDGSVAILRP